MRRPTQRQISLAIASIPVVVLAVLAAGEVLAALARWATGP